ncbi:MAG: pro-sigmaK processing inhibitor BofA family protein [Clostridia bacterium]|nr:pro-sigmaK processing inhibitor BofA family protein [Clostridia bacterium]
MGLYHKLLIPVVIACAVMFLRFILKKKIPLKFISFLILKNIFILNIINYISIYWPKVHIPISALSMTISALCGLPGIAMMELFNVIL